MIRCSAQSLKQNKPTRRGLLTSAVIVLCLLHISAQADVPNKTSGLEGWQGVHINKRNKDRCDLQFPERFGYQNGRQLQALLTLIRGTPVAIENDVPCLAPPANYALEQLLKLAVEMQDQRVAHLILRPSVYGGLNLDGELAEDYTLDMKLPVMLGYKKMKNLLVADPSLGSDTIGEIVDGLCSEWGYDPEKIAATSRGLKANGLGELATQFKKKCDQAVAGNPDIQRMLKNR